MSYVLILFFTWANGPNFAMQDFSSKENCDAAAHQLIRDVGTPNDVKYSCVPK